MTFSIVKFQAHSFTLSPRLFLLLFLSFSLQGTSKSSSCALPFFASCTFQPHFHFLLRARSLPVNSFFSNVYHAPISARPMCSAASSLTRLSTSPWNSAKRLYSGALPLSATPVFLARLSSAAPYTITICCALKSPARSLSAQRKFKNSARPSFILNPSPRALKRLKA